MRLKLSAGRTHDSRRDDDTFKAHDEKRLLPVSVKDIAFIVYNGIIEGRTWRTNMPSENVNVRVTGDLRAHVEQQTSDAGLYENASEYVRALIRKDLMDSREAWSWLRSYLEPALRAKEGEFVEVSVSDVIARNKS